MTKGPIKQSAVNASFSIAVMVLFIFITDPQTLPAPMLLVLPILVLVSAYSLIRLMAGVVAMEGTPKQPKSLSFVLALAPTLLMVFGSLGQLGIQDIGLTLVLIAGLGWYIKRTTASDQLS